MILEYRGVVVGSESCGGPDRGRGLGGFLMVTPSQGTWRQHLFSSPSFLLWFHPRGSEFALLGHFFFLKLLPPRLLLVQAEVGGRCCSYHGPP